MQRSGREPGVVDRAPGDPDEGGRGRQPGKAGAAVRGYLTGLAFAVALTFASFQVASSQFIWGPGVPVALVVLAIAQMGVHLVFFLHVSTGPDNTNNVLALAFGVLIVLLVVGGTLWIMSHLNANMMPMNMPDMKM